MLLTSWIRQLPGLMARRAVRKARRVRAGAVSSGFVGLSESLENRALLAANLVNNGGFEQNSGLGPILDNSPLPGWVSGNSGGLTNNFVSNSANGFPAGSNGGFYVAFLFGLGTTQPFQQTVNGLTPGNDYTLSFETAVVRHETVTGAFSAGVDIEFGTDTVSVDDRSVDSNGATTWETSSFTFTAISTSQTLGFRASTRTGLPGYLLLDGVRIEGPDATAPTLTSFTRHTPSTTTTDADSLVFRATFDEAVQNVDAADFAVNGTTTATVTGVTSADSGAGLLWDVTVSGGDLASFNGTVGLDLSGSQNITDLANNALANGEPTTDETYTVSNLPVNFEVGTLDDEDDGQTTQDSDLSLREAIRLANADVNASTITFASSLFTSGDQTMFLTLFDTGLDAGEFGPTAFTISTPITINGPTGANGLTIFRNLMAPAFRLFDVHTAGSLTLDSLTLSGGVAQGGNGFSGGGGAAGMGGAIFNQGTLTITNSTLTANGATGGAGGTGSTGGGGGVGQVAQFTVGGGPHGGAAGGGAGGFGGGAGGGNNTNSNRGGVGGFGGGGGGGINGGGAGGFGGGGGGKLSISSAPLASAGFGGGGGGSNKSGGGAGMGGAIFNQSGTVTITNSSFGTNVATGGGGTGSHGQGLGGAIFTRNGVVTILNSTFSENTANDGGGAVFVVSDSDTGSGFSGGSAEVAINNSILANTVGSASDFAAHALGSGVNSFSGAGNLIENNAASGTHTGTFTGTVVSSADPMLSALADHGGPTKTFALNSASPAIDAGDSVAGAAAGDFDQRGNGFARVEYDVIDSGAFEFFVAPTLTAAVDGFGNLNVTDSDATGIDNQFTVSSFDVNGEHLEINGGTQSFDAAILTALPQATLSNQNRTLTIPLSALTGTSIEIDGRLGSDVVTIDDTHLADFEFVVRSESIAVQTATQSALLAKSVAFVADAVTILAGIIADSGNGLVTILPQTDGQLIDLGGLDAVGTLGLTDGELDFIQADTLSIGTLASGAITVSNAVSLGVPTLELNTGGAVDAVGSSLQVGMLAVSAVGAVTLTNSETAIGTLAVESSGAVTVTQSDGFIVGSVSYLSGIDNTIGSGDVSLTSLAGGVTIRDAIVSNGAITVSAAGDIQQTNAASLNNSSSTTPQNLSVTTSAGSVNLDGSVRSKGDITVSATGLVTFGSSGLSNTSGSGDLSITSSADGVTVHGALSTSGTLTVSAAGDINQDSGAPFSNTSSTDPKSFNVTSTAGAVTLYGSLRSNGDITVSGSKLVTIGYGGLSNTSGSGDVSITSSTAGVTMDGAINSAGKLTVSAVDEVMIGFNGLSNTSGSGALSVTSSAAGVTANGAISSSGAITVSGAELVTIGFIGMSNTSGSGDVSITSTAGGVTANGTINSHGAITVSGAELVTIGFGGMSNASGSGDLSVTSTAAGVTVNGGLTTTGTLTVSAAGDIHQAGGAPFSNGGSAVPKNISVTTSTGAVTLNDDFSSNGNITVSAPGAINFAHGGMSVDSGDASETASISIHSTGADGSITTGSGVNLAAKAFVSLTADHIQLGGTVSASNGSVTLQPTTANRQIDLGTETDGKLGLTDAELDLITASTVVVGNSDSGPITISVPLDQPTINTLQLNGNTTIAGNGGYTFQIGGKTAGTEHDLIHVNGSVTIDSQATVSFVSTNKYALNPADQFTLLTNDADDAVTGNFGNLPITDLLGSGLPGFVNTNGGDGNDLVLVSDTTPPDVTVTPNSGVTNASPITFTFQFTEPVTGFDASDVSVRFGTKGTFSAVDGDTYTLLVTPSGDGPVTVTVAQGAAQDVANNGNTRGSATVTSDRTAPDVAVLIDADITNASPITVTFQFSEPVTGFDASDVSVTNATKGTFSAVDSDTYTLLVTPTADGTVEVTVAENAAQDAATNGSTLGGAAVTSDRTNPTVAVTPNTGITNGSPITFTFQFSETVTGFDASDVSVSNGTKGTFSAIDGDTYTLLVTPTADGTVTASVAANSAQDAATNGNTADSGSITSDRTKPTLAITPVFTQTNAHSFTFTFQFSEPVTGFVTNDVVVTNATKGTFTAVDGDTYTLVVNPTADGAVGISVANNAARDSATNGSTAASASIRSDRTVPTVVIGSPSKTKTQLGPVSFPLTFADANFDVSTLTADDVTLNTTGSATGTISVDDETGTTRTVTISNISGEGTLGISLKIGTARDKAGNVVAATSPSATFSVVKGITVTRDENGNVLITDTKSVGTNDALTITADNANRVYIINEPTAFVSSTVPGAVQVDDHTISFAYSKVFGPSVIVSAGQGDDTIVFKGSGKGSLLLKPITINGDAGRDQITLDASLVGRFNAGVLLEGGTEDDVLSATSITGTGSFPVTLAGAAGNDSLTGGDGNDVIRGGAGEDVLIGGNGNDNLSGQGGVDSLTGGLGDDSIDGGASADRLIEVADSNLTLTTTSLLGLGTDVLTAIEAASLDGGVSANRLDASGFAGDVILRGNAGNDTLVGGVGADILRGGDGDDVLTGGAGNDQFIGNLGIDTVSETANENFTVSSGAQVDPTLPDSTLVGLGTDGLQSIEIVKLTGGNGANRFDASTFNGRVSLDGGAGNDTLIGTALSDTLIGGAGDDVLNGNAGSDSMEGNAGNDSLTGGLGRDTLDGGVGTDTLDGGSGHVDTIRYDLLDRVISDAFDFLIQM